MKQETEKRAEKVGKKDIADSPALPAVPLQEAEEEPIVNLVDIAVKGGRIKPAEDVQKDSATAPSSAAPARDAAPPLSETQPETPPQPVAEETSAEPDATAGHAEEEQPVISQKPAPPQNMPDHEQVVSIKKSRSRKAKPKKDAAAAAVPTHGHADTYHLRPRRAGGGLIRLLPAVAWLILVAGIIGAVLSWTTIKDVEASLITTPVPDLKTLPIGLLLGFAYLATGVLGFAFFWVSSLISRQLRDIRHFLFNLSLPRLAAEREELSRVVGENDAGA